MKRIKFLAVGLFILGSFAISAMAQAPASKLAIINTNAFYDAQSGIKKVSAEYQKLQVEFKPVNDQLDTLGNKLKKLEGEIKTMQAAMQANTGVPIKEADYRVKTVEYENLAREFKFKEDEAKANAERREAEVMQPVMGDILEKISAYSKQKGFDLVLDVDNLFRNGSLLYFNDSINITAEFIKYYNALPPGSATVR